jgi:hypothetical protein
VLTIVLIGGCASYDDHGIVKEVMLDEPDVPNIN